MMRLAPLRCLAALALALAMAGCSKPPQSGRVVLTDVAGLQAYAPVIYEGLNVGTVTGMQAVPEGVLVTFEMNRGDIRLREQDQARPLVKAMVTCLEIVPGDAGAPEIKPDTSLAALAPKEQKSKMSESLETIMQAYDGVPD